MTSWAIRNLRQGQWHDRAVGKLAGGRRHHWGGGSRPAANGATRFREERTGRRKTPSRLCSRDERRRASGKQIPVDRQGRQDSATPNRALAKLTGRLISSGAGLWADRRRKGEIRHCAESERTGGKRAGRLRRQAQSRCERIRLGAERYTAAHWEAGPLVANRVPHPSRHSIGAPVRLPSRPTGGDAPDSMHDQHVGLIRGTRGRLTSQRIAESPPPTRKPLFSGTAGRARLERLRRERPLSAGGAGLASCKSSSEECDGAGSGWTGSKGAENGSPRVGVRHRAW